MKLRTSLIMAIVASLFAANSQAMIIKVKTNLDGNQEVGPVATKARGKATLKLNLRKSLVDFTLNVRGIFLEDIKFPKNTPLGFGNLGPVHLHSGLVGANGPIVLSFEKRKFYSKTNRGFKLQAKGLTAPAELEKLLSIGGVYINVHTLKNGGGEIRGQLSTAVPEPSTFALLGLAGMGLMLRRLKAIQA